MKSLRVATGKWLIRLVGCSTLLALATVLAMSSPVAAQIQGICSDCHTMHNSQNGAPMAMGANLATKPMLVKGDCVGCHAQGGALKIAITGTIPQASHSDPSGDLAAGNFAYISGTKGSGASAAKGHNVIDLWGANSDPALNVAPGAIMGGHNTFLTDSKLTCAGRYGCHGLRYQGAANLVGLVSLKGAHHGNVDGKCNTADTVANSYRFLRGVKGLENKDSKWQNVDSTDHNEYFGASTPLKLGCSAATDCHAGTPQNTISGFCGSCHSDFHSLPYGSYKGIGPTATSPFVRHPSDVVIKNSGEYAAYTVYNVDAPVGRITTVPENVSGVVNPGSDVVTCLSCHLAHASDYPDMLRWNYNMNAHSGNNNTGCFICHTTKDDV